MKNNQQLIGIATEVPMGNWNATTPYQKLNTVRYNGATYIAKKQNRGVQPTVTQGWQEVWQVQCYDGGSLSIPAMLDLFIPVGKTIPQYYGEPTPAEQFAGTSWEIDTTMQGRVPIGSGDGYTFGATGGSKEHKHASGNLIAQFARNPNSYSNFLFRTATAPNEWGGNFNIDVLGSGDKGTDGLNNGISVLGDTSNTNIMPPYTVVNYWKRIA